MGAWSEGIFDNDTALDCLEEMEGVFSIEDIDTEGLSKKNIKAINRLAEADDTQRQLIALIRSQEIVHDRLVAGQVVCSLLMMAGARIAPKLQQIGIMCAKDKYENWSDPEARKLVLEQFKDQLSNYEPGQVVSTESTGLFEKLSSLFKRD